jgi:hypothetical protein
VTQRYPGKFPAHRTEHGIYSAQQGSFDNNQEMSPFWWASLAYYVVEDVRIFLLCTKVSQELSVKNTGRDGSMTAL